MKCLVIHIGADSIDKTKVLEVSRRAEVLLLVQDVVLGASNDTSILDTLDSLGNSNARKNRVRAEAFPVASTLGVPAKRADHGAKLNIDTFTAMFHTHLVASTVELAAVPRGGDGASGCEGGNIVGKADTKRAVLRTEAGEAETRNSSSVTHTFQVSSLYRIMAVLGCSVTHQASPSHPTPVVRLTFSSRVNCRTKACAFETASAQPGAELSTQGLG